MLEDPLTYMIEPEHLAEHVRQLREMKGCDVAEIFSNHGDPDIIRAGGYDKTLIDATVDYVTRMLMRAMTPAISAARWKTISATRRRRAGLRPSSPTAKCTSKILRS